MLLYGDITQLGDLISPKWVMWFQSRGRVMQNFRNTEETAFAFATPSHGLVCHQPAAQ